MSKILVVSPDTIPLKSSGDSVNLKTTAYTAIGKRCYLLAKYLQADLAVPTINCNLPSDILKSQGLIDIVGEVIPYDYDEAINKYSKELEEIFNQYDVVVVQSTYGIGWANVHKYYGKVIIDGLAPFLAEYQYLSKLRGYDKKLVDSYNKLMLRADITLYANQNQFQYYKENFYPDGRVPLIHVPYGMEDKNSFLIFGPLYPWIDSQIYNILIHKLQYEKFCFVGSVHPRFKGLSKDTLNLLDKFAKFPNVDISLADQYIPINRLPHNYHLALCFGFEDSLETKLASRTRVINLLDQGFHVVTNNNDSLKNELDAIYKVDFVDTTNPFLLANKLFALINKYQSFTYNCIYGNLCNELTKLGVE